MLKLLKNNSVGRLIENYGRENVFKNLNVISRRLYSSSEEISPTYKNRNPRNLEWSGHQYKRFGWNLQYPPKDFYHQLYFTISDYGLETYVEHCTGEKIIQISTADPEIRQYLNNNQDLNSAIVLAKLVSERCAQFGITNLTILKSPTYEDSKKEQLFFKTVISTGLLKDEVPFVEKTNEIPGLDYENKDFYQERLNLEFPPIVNRLKRENLKRFLENKNNETNKNS